MGQDGSRPTLEAGFLAHSPLPTSEPIRPARESSPTLVFLMAFSVVLLLLLTVILPVLLVAEILITILLFAMIIFATQHTENRGLGSVRARTPAVKQWE